MTRRTPALLLLLCLLAGCAATAPKPALITTSRQPVMSPDDSGYLACATALYGTYRVGQLRLKPAYQSGLVEDGEFRLFRLSGWLYENGERQQARFECLTEPSRRAKVLGLSRLSTRSPVLAKRDEPRAEIGSTQ